VKRCERPMVVPPAACSPPRMGGRWARDRTSRVAVANGFQSLPRRGVAYNHRWGRGPCFSSTAGAVRTARIIDSHTIDVRVKTGGHGTRTQAARGVAALGFLCGVIGLAAG